MQFARAMWDVAAGKNPRDWVDVQSFIWVLSRISDSDAKADADGADIAPAVILIALALAAAAFARLGETEQDLIKRFGQPVDRGQHTTYAQGKTWVLGPTIVFQQDDWRITCDLIDGRVARIRYTKRGAWTEDQIQIVLGSNSQGGAWTEAGNPKAVAREWKRSDGAVAKWISFSGMTMIVPAYQRAVDVIEAKAKAEVSKKPKV